jgi:hypothetical protein
MSVGGVGARRLRALLFLAIVAAAGSACRATVPMTPVWSRGEFGPPIRDPAGCDAPSASQWELTFVHDAVVRTRRRFERVRRDRMPYELDLSGVLLPPPLVDPGRPEVRRAPHDATAPTPLDDDTRRRTRTAARAARRVVVRTSLGWLVGFDGGLHGGSLWWFPAQPGDGRLLWPGNIRFLELMGSEVVALSGSGYPNRGVVLTLSRHPMYGWMVRSSYGVSAQPSARLHIAPDRLLVASRSELLEVSKGQVTQILGTYFSEDPLTVARSSRGDFVVNFRNYAHLIRRHDRGFTPEWFRLPDCRRMASE